MEADVYVEIGSDREYVLRGRSRGIGIDVNEFHASVARIVNLLDLNICVCLCKTLGIFSLCCFIENMT